MQVSCNNLIHLFFKYTYWILQKEKHLNFTQSIVASYPCLKAKIVFFFETPKLKYNGLGESYERDLIPSYLLSANYVSSSRVASAKRGLLTWCEKIGRSNASCATITSSSDNFKASNVYCCKNVSSDYTSRYMLDLISKLVVYEYGFYFFSSH